MSWFAATPSPRQAQGGWETLGAPPAEAPAPTAAPSSALPATRFGPVLLADGRTRFRLWAPDAAGLGAPPRLEVQGQGPLVMTERPDAPGWFEAVAPCGPGARYWFRLGDGAVVPDPASRAQDGDVHGPSIVVDPANYHWSHPYWTGRPWHEAVVIELHAGLCGGFAGVSRELPRLAALGFTAVELMPVADFPGAHNWGYDGVLPFAPDASYGTPDDLRALVDTAHGLGLMVLLDVVCNHFGPEGNYLGRYASPFFRNDLHTPWGAALDFRRQEVRDFFTENAACWLHDFRFDGLRFDAVHAIADEGWLAGLAPHLRRCFPGRHIHLVLENDRNDAALLDRRGAGYDAQWNDDGHHALHVLLTGERSGYYVDYAYRVAPADDAGNAANTDPRPAATHHLARVLAEGFAYQGEVSRFRSTPDQPAHRGQPSRQLPPTAFVLFLQNHDQTGNRALGERLATLADPDALRAAVALQLLSPQIPLVFMGEECGADTPFLYFTSHPPELGEAVREGRRREFRADPAFATPERAARIPDPNDPATFEASRPVPSDDAGWPAFYRALLTLRRREIVPRLPGARSTGATVLGPGALRAGWILGDGSLLTLWTNLGDAPVACEIPSHICVLAESADGAGGALAAGTLPAHATVACLREAAIRPREVND